MSLHNCSCTRNALYNVFVAPSFPRHAALKPPNLVQRRFKKFTRTRSPNIRAREAAYVEHKVANLNRRQIRTEDRHGHVSNSLHRGFPYTKIHGLPIPPLPPRDQRAFNVPYDEEITEPWIALVDRDSMYHPRVSLDEVMRNLNRLTEHLLQVTPVDPASGKLPTCKIYSKIHLSDARSARNGKANGGAKKVISSKSLEVNWAIAEGDLGVKLSQLEVFLREGRKVEMILARKKRARAATGEECQAVLKKIRGAAGRVPGAKEEKTEGKIGERMTLVFESQQMIKKREEGKERE